MLRHMFKACVTIGHLKQLGRYASRNHNIYTAADLTPVDINHAAHADGSRFLLSKSSRPVCSNVCYMLSLIHVMSNLPIHG